MAAVLVPALATALGGGVFATAVSQIAVGLALSYVSQALFSEDTPRQTPAAQTSRTNGTTAPQRVLLGRVRTAGHDAFPPYCHDSFGSASSSKSGKYLTLGVALSDVPVSGLHSVIIQDLEFVVGTHLTDQGSSAGLQVPSGLSTPHDRYRNKIWVQFYDGNQVAADPFMRTVFAGHPDRPYTSDMVYAGGAYALVHVRYDPELWTNLSDIGWVVDGMLVDGSFTRNPITLANAIASGITLPSGDIVGPQKAFDEDWLIPAINACDTEGFVAGLEYQVGGPDGQGMTSLDVIEDLLAAGAGKAWDDGGSLRVSAFDGGLPVVSITDDTILRSRGSIAEKAGSLKDRTNSVTISHPNSEELWKVVPAPTQTDAAAVLSDGERLPAALTLPAVSVSDQAQRLAGMFVADAQRFRVHTFALPLSFGFLTINDKISWTSDRHSYVNKVFRVETITRETTYTLVTVRETDPDDFDPNEVSLNPYVPTVSNPTGPGELIPSVGFSADVQSDNGEDLTAGAFVVVTNTPDIAQGVRWEIRIQGKTATLSGTFDAASAFIPLSSDATYEGRAMFITADRVTPWSAWFAFTTDDVRPTLAQLDGTVADAIAAASKIPVVNALPSDNTQFGDVVVLSTDQKLYRWDGSAFTREVDVVDLAGQIGQTQITDGAISTSKLAASSIVGANIASGAVDTNNLAANSVVAGKVAAGAIGTTALAADSVTAAKVAANAIVAGNITANAVETAKIDTDAVTNQTLSLVTSAYATSSQNTWTTFHTFVMNRTSGFQTRVLLFFECNFFSSGAAAGRVRLRRSSTTIATYGVDVNDEGKTYQWIDTDTSGGSTTYTLQAITDDIGDTWGIDRSYVDSFQRKR